MITLRYDEEHGVHKADENHDVIGGDIVSVDPNIFIVYLIKAELPNGTIYLNTCGVEIDYNNNIYVGTKLLNIEPIGGSSLQEPVSIKISVTGILESDRAIFKRPVGVSLITLSMIASEDNGETWVKIGNDISGPISSPRLVGGTYSFEISLKNISATNNRVRNWSHEDQIRRYGAVDQGMSQMKAFEDQSVIGIWPQIGEA